MNSQFGVKNCHVWFWDPLCTGHVILRMWLVAAAVSFDIAEWLWRYILGVLQQLADGLVVAVLFRIYIYSVC